MKTTAKLLLVDGDPAILLATRQALGDDRYTIETVTAGAQVIETLRVFQPDLVLLDVNLTDISGYDVCRQIKNDPELNKSLVVLISAISTDSESQADGLEEGADSYIVRPVSNRELVARVDALLRLKATQDALRTQEAETRNLLKQKEQAERALLSILEDRQQAESKLRESEGRYRELFVSNPHPMWVYDLQSLRFLAVNDAAVLRYGYSHEEFLHMTLRDIRPAEDVPGLLENIADNTSELQSSSGWRHILKDGSIINVEITSHALIFDGKQARLVLAHDVTQQIQAEDALKKSELRFRATFEQAAMGIAHVAPDGHWLRVNQKLCDILGYSREELLTMTSQELTHPDDLEKDLALMQKVLSGEIENYAIEKRYSRKDGMLIWINLTVSLLREERGLPVHFISVIEDITERKKMEISLRVSEENYRNLAETSDSAIAVLDREGTILYANRESMRTWNDHQLVGKTIVDLYPEELANRYLSVFRSVINDQVVDLSELEAWVNGQMRWFRISLSPLKNSDGMVDALLMNAWDLTDRRQAEKARAESEERYRSLLDQLPAIVYLDDASIWPPRTVFVSPRVQDILGYSPEEWLAGGFELWTSRIHADDIERVIAHYLDCIQNGSVYSQDYRIITRDGQTIWVHDAAAVQRNERGAPISLQGVIHDITGNKNSEAVLRLQSAALEAADNAIIISDTQGIIQWTNPAFTRLTGYSVEEAVGKPIRLLSSGKQDNAFYKDLWDTILAGRVWRGELINKRKDGSFYYEEQIITPLTDPTGQTTHFIGVKQDITDRKQSEEKIQRHVERLTALREIDQTITSSFDMRASLDVLVSRAVKLLSADAVAVLLANPSTDTLTFETGIGFRKNAPQTAGVKIGESYAGKAALEKRLVKIPNLAYDPNSSFLTGFLKDENFISYYGVPLIVKGKVLGVLEVFYRSVTRPDEEWFNVLTTLAGQAAIAIDNAQLFSASQRELLERKMADDQLRKSYTELEKRIEERTSDLRRVNFELERALRVKDEFLANMSHELRTPLNAVIGLSDSLSEQTAGPLNEKQNKYVNTIRESGQHLLDLINDILDLAKIESGQINLSRDKVDVSLVSQASLRMIKQLALKKKLDVVFEMDANLGMIWADERRLKQMIVNLLSNAVKFTPENGRIGLQVRGEQENNLLRFTVWDTGIGIHENDLPRLFHPFVQLDSNLARRSSGTGLGLALVAKMAGMHGGSISVESMPGEGSRFTIKLPWETAQNTGQLSDLLAAKSSAAKPQALGQKYTVLLVEDTEDVVLLIKDYLEHIGFRVVTAENGMEGIALAEKIRPSLILMDIQMPVLDGLEATRRIRKIRGLESTPIIALTALAMKGDRERCLEAGLTDYISKPLSLKTLAGLIQSHLYEGRKDATP